MLYPQSNRILQMLFWVCFISVIGIATGKMIFEKIQNRCVEHHIVNTNIGYVSDIQLEQMWVMGIGIDNYSKNTPLVISEGRLIAFTCDDNVLALDVENGNEIWNREHLAGREIYINQSSLYVVEPDSHYKSIRRLNPVTGETIWKNEINISHAGIYVHFQNDGNLIIQAGLPPQHIYLIEPHNGALTEVSNFPPNTVEYTGDYLLTQERNLLTAMSSEGKTLWRWEQPISRTALPEPVLADNVLLLRNGRTDKTLVALEKNSGELLWELDEIGIISNIAYQGDLLYFLDTYVTFHAINIYTGETAYTVEFPGHSKDIYAVMGSWVAASDDVIAIFFQDNNTLAVFRLIP